LSNITQYELDLCNKIRSGSIFLGPITHTFSGLPHQSDLKSKGEVLAVGGNEIGRYKIKGTKGFFDKQTVRNLNNKIKQFSEPKIISQRIVAHVNNPQKIILTSTYDKMGVVCVNTVSCIRANDEKYDLKSLLLILNSELISWYAYRFIYNKAIRSMDFYDYFVSKIPIVSKLENYDLLLNFICSCILFLHEKNCDKNDIKKFDELANIIVFELYFNTSNPLIDILLDFVLKNYSKKSLITEKTINLFLKFYASKSVQKQSQIVLKNSTFKVLTNGIF